MDRHSPARGAGGELLVGGGELGLLVHDGKGLNFPDPPGAKKLARPAPGVARIDAEKSPFLTERLKIWMLPTLALISKEKVLDYVVGFDDFGGTDDFPPEHLRCCLAAKNMLTYEGGDEGSDANPRAQKKSTVVIEKRNLRKGGGTLVLGSEDETSDFSD